MFLRLLFAFLFKTKPGQILIAETYRSCFMTPRVRVNTRKDFN